MKKLFGTAAIAAALALTAGGPAYAAGWKIDFETYFADGVGQGETDFIAPPQDINDTGHGDEDFKGQIVDTEYLNGITATAPGSMESTSARVRILGIQRDHFDHDDRAESMDFLAGAYDNRAVIFNTNEVTGGDPDLGRSGHPEDFGNILIVHEHDNCSTSKDVCGDLGNANNGPDDDAGGSYLFFHFEEAVTLTGMQVFDVEEDRGGKVFFFGEDGNDLVEIGMEDLPMMDDGATAMMSFNDGDGYADVIRMVVKFKGSGAVDRIMGDADTPGDEVPEPAGLGLVLAGLAGLGIARRRAARKGA